MLDMWTALKHNISMNRLSTADRGKIIRALVEGNSLRSTVRMTGFAMNTIMKLLRDLGAVCSDYQDRVLRDLPCERIECDEIWAYVGSKARNVPEGKEGEFGDWWTWVAIDPVSKLVPSWLVGQRDAADARSFIADLADRLTHRVQLTTDGHRPYLEAVEDAFGSDIDYAMLIKLYGTDPEAGRFSPPVVIAEQARSITGDPDPSLISTSYVERQNLTMRMSMRRFTRLTNGFSKKVENHAAAVAVHYMFYNFARPHTSLRNPYPRTPAMAAGISDHVWTCEEIAALLD
jgi:IS1 family transposase